jgi:hypothetical protein
MASCLDTDEGLICSSAEYLNIKDYREPCGALNPGDELRRRYSHQ